MRLIDVDFKGLSWVQGTGDPDGPGVLSPHGSWTTAAGSKDQIFPSGNGLPGSSGGYLRHWRGPGQSNNGGGVNVVPRAQSTAWKIRFHMRYSPKYQWLNGRPHFTKDLYINVGRVGQAFAILGFSGGAYYIHLSAMTGQPGGSNLLSSFQYPTDGQWHCYEADLDAAAGFVELLADGKSVLRRTGVTFGFKTFDYALLGSNFGQLLQATDEPTDYAELAIDDAVMPGPLGAAPPPPPPPPPPPIVIAGIGDVFAQASAPGGEVVSFPAPSVSGGVPPLVVDVQPASGSLFPEGASTVVVTAKDAAGQSALASFVVDVSPYVPPPPPPPPPPVTKIAVEVVDGALVVTPL